MFSQQGRKGKNQDATTVWENFAGREDAIFCGVFDGHGPLGHKVAQNVLPSKLSSTLKHSHIGQISMKNDVNSDDDVYDSVKKSILQAFKGMDEDLEVDDVVDSFFSGTTAVSVLKKGRHLFLANLGDSRAVLCTRDSKDKLRPVQMTVEMKPNLPSEFERIRKCKGRVLPIEAEPSVHRVWRPEQDAPGLAMSRAFGDFCLKDFGLISVPEICYRKLTAKDEFLVLATDGIWDVLSNEDVIRIVSSASKRSVAARLLVAKAVRAWRYKFPNSRIDDCAVICLFFKREAPHIPKSMSEKTHLSLDNSQLSHGPEHGDLATEDGRETVLNCEMPTRRDPINRHHLATIHEEKYAKLIYASAETHRYGHILQKSTWI